MLPGQKWDEFTPEQLRQLEARKWSDMDVRLRNLEGAAQRCEALFQQATGVLAFVKWASATAVVLAAVWVWLEKHVKFTA
jgi:hypothetical protein